MFLSIASLLTVSLLLPIASSLPYAMYVWRTGWDPDVLGCINNNAEFLSWNHLTSPCFTHTWSTPAKRDWLWSTCSRRNGRNVDQLFLYDFSDAISTRDCDSEEVSRIKVTLFEGHGRIPGLQIYALFSDGGDSVPEQRRVLDVVWYNTNCAQNSRQTIDGVAVNNENWNRSWNSEQMKDYLNNLNNIKINAATQNPPGSLKTHFSVGWLWGKDPSYSDQDIVLTWNGVSQPVMRHFIDIFDEIDVQVAFVTADAMESRLKGAELEYAISQGKPTMATIYINKSTPCQTTFFPFAPNTSDCPEWSHPYKNETQMWEQLDAFQTVLPQVKIVLHYFRGAYSSGGQLGWPKH